MTRKHPPGATLHLGGTAWAHPDLDPALVWLGPAYPPMDEHHDLGCPQHIEGPADNPTTCRCLDDHGHPHATITPYPGNPRRGDQDAITASLRDLGLYRAIIVQRSTGFVLAGNHTLAAVLALGGDRIPVTWVDVDDTRAAAIVARDNRTSDLGTYDEGDLLALLTADPDVLALSGYVEEDLTALLAGADEVPPDAGYYTRKMDAITYTPTMETPPPVADLADYTKARELAEQITAALTAGTIEPSVGAYLMAAAHRHTVFNYAKAAEFYAHATPEVQALMEASALVVPDIDDAISHGFVRLSTRLAALMDADLTERARLDGEAGPNA